MTEQAQTAVTALILLIVPAFAHRPFAEACASGFSGAKRVVEFQPM